ncbi:hypothetical protein B0H65DRAFT_317869 [Neurospora tetraspora]|uniref:Uncharacterized protein n=1 Tax=Neurospora tetraspora TaxID=94610 RepID=A0AAE0J7B0_9PEZI|nr:hypothetical protein B0H65DRAFT_317869 [Neurospora tetraspora]
MNSAPKPSLLGLPVEVRLQIYQHIWTISQEEQYLGWAYTGRYYCQREITYLKASYLKAQLSAISTLGAIYQKIRNEAYAEYFHTTQIYLGWGYFDFWEMSPFYQHDREALELIRTSYLLQTRARHICLHWVDVPPFEPLGPLGISRAQQDRYFVTKRMRDNHKIAMECLETRFPNAITLDVICDVNPFDDAFWYFWRAQHFELSINITENFNMSESYYGDRDSERIKSLPFRRLEKAVVRTVSRTYPRGMSLFRDHEEAAWFRRFKEDVATLVAPREEGDEDRSYIIKNHIGGIYLKWPRSYKI